MLDWKEKKIKEFCDFKYGKNLPEHTRSQGKYPVYGSASITSYHNEYLIEAPGIIIGRKGTVGKIQLAKNNFYPIDTTFYIDKYSTSEDILFLYYRLQLCGFSDMNSDAAVPGLNKNAAINQKIKLPPIATQQKIASILSAYDDLIENNLKRIKLLEEMAQITYEEWFVRLKFPGHETTPLDSATGLPEGWRFGKTLDLFELQRGFDLPIQEREDGDIPIIASTGTTGFHSSYKVKAPGVVTGRSGTVGQVMFVDSDFWPLNTTLWVKKFKSCGPIFVKHFLENFNLESLCGGSAVPSLDRKAVHVQKVAIPAAELTKKFEIYASSLYDTTKVLRSQNELLKEARDILLPRLMTGMIDVDTVGADLSARMNMVAPCEYPLGHK